MKIFLICPVAKITPDEEESISKYVSLLEDNGNTVHWPLRDTKQDDPTGGLTICRTNFQAILDADEIHIWYNETSGGSKFDMGGVFMLTEMLGVKKRIVIPNKAEVKDDAPKSFFQVIKHLEKKTF